MRQPKLQQYLKAPGTAQSSSTNTQSLTQLALHLLHSCSILISDNWLLSPDHHGRFDITTLGEWWRQTESNSRCANAQPNHHGRFGITTPWRMVEADGIEPLLRECATEPLWAVRHHHPLENGGGRRDRTDNPLLAKQVLYQLSYAPIRCQKSGIRSQARNHSAF